LLPEFLKKVRGRLNNISEAYFFNMTEFLLLSLLMIVFASKNASTRKVLKVQNGFGPEEAKRKCLRYAKIIWIPFPRTAVME
jgi:hypothetical protein